MTLYAGYRVEAVVDWAEFQVALKRASNGGALNRFGSSELGFNARFRPLDKGAGGAASVFSFRIQDPPGWPRIGRLLNRLGEEYAFASEPIVTGMEVSLDAYASRASVEMLANLTAERYRFMQTQVSRNHRYSGRKARKKDVQCIAANTLRQRLAEGRNIVIGNKNDRLSQRFYVKTTDMAGSVTLPQDAWRSRWEITLQGPAMPFGNVDDAQHYRFEDLAGFFGTRLPQKDLGDFDCLRMDAQLRPGKKRDKQLARRWYSSQTAADSTANALVYAALRRLTRRMNPKRSNGGRKAIDRNSVTLHPRRPRKHKKSPPISINYIQHC